MKKNFCYLFVLIFYLSISANSGFSQEKPAFFELKGKLISDQNQKIDEVTLHLLNTNDKKLVKIEYVTQSGQFTFDKIPKGNYTLVTQSMAYIKYESVSIELNKNTDLGSITLSPLSNNLNEVSIAAVKPFIQQQYDKTVINVSSSIAAVGSTALEVLEKAPGITIDQNDNIAMRGRQGVLVMIDGKLVPMSGQDLANMLRSMSANQIEKIDLITNPSSKYDASGNSGIIDIRLKKGKNDGLNGNVTMSYSQGIYPKLNPSVNINHKVKNLNIFASYNYSFREDMTELKIFRNFYSASDQVTGGNDFDNFFKFTSNSHNGRIGADYNLGKNTIIGFAANGIFTSGSVQSASNTNDFNATHELNGSLATNGKTHPIRNNGSINFNFKQVLDTAGRELTADFDYARYINNDIQNYHTQYFGVDGLQSKDPYTLFGDLKGKLNIKSFKVDYTHPVKSIGANLEAGIKASWVEADNDVAFFDRSNGGNIPDLGKSNRFLYDEQINAAYINASKKWTKLHLQLGLRLENTIAKGTQVTNNDNFDKNYTQLFPSGYLGYKFNKQHDLGISVSRRIDRPSYRQLNPFKIFLNPLTYAAGNPFLNPEITTSMELTYTFLQKYTTKLGYSRTTDNILNVLSPDVEPGTVIQTFRNLAKFDYYNLSFSFPVTIGKWFNSSNTALMYYGEYKGNLVNTNLNASRLSFNFNSSNSIIIDNNTSLEVLGSYQSKSTYGFLEVGKFWSAGLGAQRQLWNKKASVKLNVSDIFYTTKIEGITKLTGYGEHFFQKRDSRVGTISFNYRFGGQGNGSRRKTGGAEEEKRRAN